MKKLPRLGILQGLSVNQMHGAQMSDLVLTLMALLNRRANEDSNHRLERAAVDHAAILPLLHVVNECIQLMLLNVSCA